MRASSAAHGRRFHNHPIRITDPPGSYAEEKRVCAREGLLCQLRGVLLCVAVWSVGTLLIAWGMSTGTVGEEAGRLLLTVVTFVASFLGAVSAVRHHPWCPLPAALAVGGGFAALLSAIPLLVWHGFAWNGHGGILLLCAVGGAVLAVPAGRRRGFQRGRGHGKNTQKG